jgi:hypothetical protein
MKGVIKMKNLLSFFVFKLITLVFAVLLLSEFSKAQLFNDDALFVVATDAENLDTAEFKIDSVLQEMGFYTTIIGQDVVTDAETNGMSLVLISATVTSGTITENMPGLGDMTVPLINWEPFLDDLLGYSESDGGEFNTTEIEIVLEGHQIAAGLPEGLVTISTVEKAVSYGVPQGDADIIAVNPNDSSQAVLFAYEEGAEMFSGNAPARRVGIFLLNDVADAMTPEGWAIFDAAVKWAMNYEEPSAVDNNLNMDIPGEFVLHNNYPNPFDKITNIKFTIPTQANIQLSVYDAMGVHITTLVDEIRPAGNYKVTFDASDMPGGLYFYRLVSGANTITKTMLLLK